MRSAVGEIVKIHGTEEQVYLRIDREVRYDGDHPL